MQYIAHVDMNCFFVACEEKHNPSLVGKPVIVGSPKDAKRGVVSTANYQARKFGVHSAMPISIAVQKCPHAIFLTPTFGLYEQESESVMTILKTFASQFEPASIDEAYLDITHFVQTIGEAKKAGELIQSIILRETGLGCSIGIARSRYVAKIASDYKKPSGVTIVEDAESFLKELDVGKISGIGKVTKSALHSAKIYTIGDLAKADRYKLFSRFGSWMLFYQNIALGFDSTGVDSREWTPKSVSREHTFQEDVAKQEAEIFLSVIADMVYDDLAKRSFRRISIKVRYGDFTTLTRDITLPFEQNSKEIILSTAQELLSQLEDKPIRLIGIKTSLLGDAKEMQSQLTMFFGNSVHDCRLNAEMKN